MPVPYIKTLVSLLGTVTAMGGLLAAKTSGHGLQPRQLPATNDVRGTGAAAVTTVTGPPIPITHGIVQVRITTAGGHITRIAATSLPHDNNVSWLRSSVAAAVLAREVIAAQSARVDAVSGATYTSEAYMKSLQAALDAVRD